MSQIKFACCFCSQRISGDDAYCGNLILCPSCGRNITVPGLSAFSTPIVAQTPVAVPQAAITADPQYWTEEAWEEHVAQVAPGTMNFQQTISLSIIGPMAILLPFLVANGLGWRFLWFIMIVSAIISGFLTRSSAVRVRASVPVQAGAFLLGLLMYAIFAEACLFGGCIWPDHP
jgi:hypothetical protein